MNDNHQSMIVYRSRGEQMRDEFWYNHPEFVVYAFYALGIFIALYSFALIFQNLYDRFKGYRRKKSRWS